MKFENMIKKIDKAIAQSNFNEAESLINVLTKKNSNNEDIFNKLIKKLGIENFHLLGGYYHNDPRFEDGTNDSSCRTAIFNSLSNFKIKELKEIKKLLMDYIKKPDIFTVWKFALVGHIISIWAADNESTIESGLPYFAGEASSLVEDSWVNSVILFKSLTNFYEKKPNADFNEYSSYLISLFYCGISASTSNIDSISEDGVFKWVWAIGANRDSENRFQDFGISNQAPWGCGEMMQEARRFAEEVIEENFEVPDGIDCEGDAYLDDYDWDILAQVIIDDR